MGNFHFKQQGNIDLSTSWTPIGNLATKFTGTYNGDGYTITGLSINSTLDTDYVGLFGYTTGATLQGINLRSVDISTTAVTNYVGAIVGYAVNTDIVDSSVDGTIEGSFDVGGVVGKALNGSFISSCTTAGSVGSTDSGSSIGGVAGSIEKSEMLNISSAAHVRNNSVDGMELGGVVGVSFNSSITNASATGSVTGGQFSGGLIGAFRTIEDDAAGTFTLSDSHATGAVAATDSGAGGIGGLVGKFQSVSPSGSTTIDVNNSYATGSVTAAGDRVGGLIGEVYLLRVGAPAPNLNFTLSNSHATGAVTGDDNVGGLIGYTFLNTPTGGSALSTSGSFATGSVRGNDSVGGLIGNVDGGQVDDSYATGTVSGVGDEALIGGFAGQVQGGSSITDSYSTGNVLLLEDAGYATGGFFGLAKEDTEITRSFATGSVEGRLGENTGGFGGFFLEGIINQSFSTGEVLGSDFTGGLIGYSGLGGTAEVSDSYSQGRVTGSRFVGLIIGSAQDGTVVNRTYGSAAVSGTATVGGAFGEVYEDGSPTSASQTHWNSQESGLLGATGDIIGTPVFTNVTGLTTVQMRTSSSFTGWDFSSVWGYQCSSSIYPQLRAINSNATAASCPIPPPDSGGGTQPSPNTPTTTTTPSTPGAIGASAAVASAPLPPGSASMLIGGQRVTLQQTPQRRGQGIELTAGPLSFQLRSQTPSGRNVPTSPDGSLVIARSGTLPITGEGLLPGSLIIQTLNSDPIDLGAATVGTGGTFSSDTSIPASVPKGDHTLTLTGTTKDGDPFTLAIGVEVTSPAAALGASPIVTTTPTKLTPGGQVNVKVTGVQARCTVTFTLGKDKTRTTANARGIAVATLTTPPKTRRTAPLRTTVSGKGCEPVTLTRSFMR